MQCGCRRQHPGADGVPWAARAGAICYPPPVGRCGRKRWVAAFALLLALVTRLRRPQATTRRPAERDSQETRTGRVGGSRRFRVLGPAHAVAGLGGIVAALHAASLVSVGPPAPAAAGTARLFVSGPAITRPDGFQLGLVMNYPDQRYIEYHVETGCDTQAREELLVLSGNARLKNSKSVISAGLVVSERVMPLGEPWFAPSQMVQVFTIPAGCSEMPQGHEPKSVWVGRCRRRISAAFLPDLGRR